MPFLPWLKSTAPEPHRSVLDLASKEKRALAQAWAEKHYADLPQQHVAARMILLVVSTLRACNSSIQVEFKKLTPQTRFVEDLNVVDSLETVELTVAIEQEFQIDDLWKAVPKKLLNLDDTIRELTMLDNRVLRSAKAKNHGEHRN